MVSHSEIIKDVANANPDLLAANDEYVLDCRKCPIRLAGLAASIRMTYMENLVHEVLSSGAAKGAHQLIAKILDWIQEAHIDQDELSDIAGGGVGLINADGDWHVALSEELRDKLHAAGIMPDSFLTGFNDQNGALLSDEMNTLVEHVYETHPGKVVCGGTVQVEGRVLCGGSLETLNPHEPDETFASQIIMAAVQKTLAQE